MSVGFNFRVRERSFVCDFQHCHQKFVSASAVARHVARAHQTRDGCSDEAEHKKEKPSGSLMCEYCSKTFNQRGKLNVHLRVHRSSSAKNFRCTEGGCQKMFFSSEGLRRHKLTHLGLKLYECDVCGVRCSSNIALKEHHARHTDHRPYSCDRCSRSFRQISCFQRHLQTHSTERRYQCLVCQSTFSQAAYLKSHMKKHTDESPYSCSICQKRFKHASDVKRHMSVHSDEKRFTCSVCPARFKDHSSCRRHIREHSAGKMYVCSVCSMPFKRPAQLKNHLRQRHGARDSVVITRATVDSTAETLDRFTSSADLTAANSVNTSCFCSSSVAAGFDVGQSCNVTAEEGDSSGRQREASSIGFHGLATACSAGNDTEDQAVVVTTISEVSDNSGFSIGEKSITVASQSFDYLHNSSCSAPGSDVLFPQDSLQLPIPTLAEDSITDIISTSNAADFSAVPPFNRPDVTDMTYLSWHIQFADTMCSTTVPLTADQLQAIVTVWSLLVREMSTVIADTSMSEQQQHYQTLLDIVRKLGAVVESHLQILQPTGTTEYHE